MSCSPRRCHAPFGLRRRRRTVCRRSRTTAVRPVRTRTGERRWRAAREAGVESVPALVRTADDRDSLLLALVENVAREDLSAVEEARAYAVLIDEFGLSLGNVSERVGRSKASVSNRLRLL